MNDFTTAFRRSVAEHGDATAMREGERNVTYAELARLAGGYRDSCLRRGVTAGSKVVLERSRGIDATAAMIGILLAGGAYTVIGEDYPQQRRAAMIDALDPTFTIDERFRPDSENASADGDFAREADSLMYVVFTSGTTSTPKAVGVPDRAVLRLLDDPRIGLASGDRITHVSPIEFDASVIELWGGLLHGMEVLCVSARDVIDPFVMLDIVANHADVMWLTTSLFNFFVDRRPEAFRGLKRVLVGGEALSLHHVNRVLPYVTVVNGYGPTENTVFTTLDVMASDHVDEICIGTAVAGTSVAIIDDDGNPAQEGELLAFGDGLALGYLNDPDKTAAAFVEVDGARAYRTGDFVRRGRDGRLAYLGRIDSQVKISGYRIDLQEVENAYLQCGAGTAKAYVEDGRLQLAVTQGGDSLRAKAAQFLPAYMQPQQIHVVAAIPTKPNGKVDMPGLRAQVNHSAGSARRMSVRQIISQQLRVELGPDDDDLFELGADSIAIWMLIAAINDEFGSTITIFDALTDPRISALEIAAGRTEEQQAA